MLGFLLLSIISGIVGYFFLWTNVDYLALLPLMVVAVYALSMIWWVPVQKLSKIHIKKYGSTLSWLLILLGIITLLISQGLAWNHVIGSLVILNIVFYLSAYQRNYQEGKTTFLAWIYASFSVAVLYSVRYQHGTNVAYIASIWSLSMVVIFSIIPLIFSWLANNELILLAQRKEISTYASIAMLFYRLLYPQPNLIIVSRIVIGAIIIAIRQNYLSRKELFVQEKKVWLSGRALLEWQKVLERHDRQHTSRDLHFFDFLIAKWYMPSRYGMKILQYAQMICIFLLASYTIYWLYISESYILLRYRIGIGWFMITLFGIQYKERLAKYYKSMAIILLTWSYYITIFDVAQQTSSFTRRSLLRLSLNMMFALFYEEVLPSQSQIFNKKDINLWLGMIIVWGIITTTSLVWLPLNSSLLFALWCIIVGMVGYFSYNIWNKHNNE